MGCLSELCQKKKHPNYCKGYLPLKINMKNIPRDQYICKKCNEIPEIISIHSDNNTIDLKCKSHEILTIPIDEFLVGIKKSKFNHFKAKCYYCKKKINDKNLINNIDNDENNNDEHNNEEDENEENENEEKEKEENENEENVNGNDNEQNENDDNKNDENDSGEDEYEEGENDDNAENEKDKNKNDKNKNDNSKNEENEKDKNDNNKNEKDQNDKNKTDKKEKKLPLYKTMKYCINSKRNICEDCWKAKQEKKKKDKRNKKKKEQKYIQYVEKNTKCLNHVKDFSYFCEDCQENICNNCCNKNEEHYGHEIKPLSDFVNDALKVRHKILKKNKILAKIVKLNQKILDSNNLDSQINLLNSIHEEEKRDSNQFELIMHFVKNKIKVNSENNKKKLNY